MRRQRPEDAEQAHDKEINLNLHMQLRLSFCLTAYPAAVRSVTMPGALRSAMFRAAGMSCSRVPRSWAIRSKTPTGGVPSFLEKYC